MKNLTSPLALLIMTGSLLQSLWTVAPISAGRLIEVGARRSDPVPFVTIHVDRHGHRHYRYHIQPRYYRVRVRPVGWIVNVVGTAKVRRTSSRTIGKSDYHLYDGDVLSVRSGGRVEFVLSHYVSDSGSDEYEEHFILRSGSSVEIDKTDIKLLSGRAPEALK